MIVKVEMKKEKFETSNPTDSRIKSLDDILKVLVCSSSILSDNCLISIKSFPESVNYWGLKPPAS